MKERQGPGGTYHVGASQFAGKEYPRFLISREQLDYLLLMSFSWTEITTLIGVSRMTIYRRHDEFGMLW